MNCMHNGRMAGHAMWRLLGSPCSRAHGQTLCMQEQVLRVLQLAHKYDIRSVEEECLHVSAVSPMHPRSACHKSRLGSLGRL